MTTNKTFVTLTGLPLVVDLKWPFHRSSSGADFYVLHGVVALADGSDLHANVSVHLALSVAELLPSLEERDAAPVVVNALRKWADRKEFEFIRSTKLQPLPLTSRFTHFKSRAWTFETATAEEIEQYLKDKFYWASFKADRAQLPIADATDVMYLGRPKEAILDEASKLVNEGWIQQTGELAVATDKYASEGTTFEQRAHSALEAVMSKHAYEAARK